VKEVSKFPQDVLRSRAEINPDFQRGRSV